MIKAASILKHGLKCHNQNKRRHHLWTSSDIRKSFVDFFVGKDHLFVPSSSVISGKNYGSYFVNAGMNQFKPLFLGTADSKTEMASFKRVTNYQKCIRIGGKHNDLDDVGRDHYHHTFFEMLGNWSFNDYGKVEACKMAWELLTKVYKIPEERLFVTYFKGDEELNLKADTTCKAIWLDIGVPDHHILPFGSKDNFWVMGETGPCGPCTEIHYCHQENIGEGRMLVNAGSNDVVEIWNLVFMEYDKRPDGSLKPLPRKHIDTGMGLERLTALLNNTISNYDTDLFQGLFSHIQKSCNLVPYGHCLTDPVDKAYRIIADHSRMFTVTIGDGMMPGRKESEGKLRTVMYKSLYQANEILRAPKGFLKSMVPVVIESLSDAYPDLCSRRNMIMDVVQETEERYLESVVTGRKLMKKAMHAFGNVNLLTGDQILQIQEGKFGKGISFDIISLLAEEFHVSLDVEDYETKLRLSQKIHAKAEKALKPLFDQHDVNFLIENDVKPTSDHSHKVTTYSETEHCYKFPLVKGKVVALKIGEEFVSEIRAGSLDCGVILDETSFYAEGGGQVSDAGELLADPSGKLYGKVSDITKCGGYIFHRIGRAENDIQLGDEAYTSIDAEHRTRCMANHTATHIVHYALEKVLGRVRQQGSFVNDDHLTFEFSCLKSQVTTEDLKKVVKVIKDIVLGKYVVSQFVAPLEDVIRAKHLFKLENEIYPNDVKVVSISKCPRDHEDPKFYEEQPGEHVSLELCGGTHVTDTDHIQELVITNLEGSVQGTKRLTAVTRDFAIEALDNYDVLKKKVEAIAELKDTEEIIDGIKRVDKLLSELVIPKLDREKILEKIKQINFDISQSRKSLLLSDIGQSIKDEITKKMAGSEGGAMVLEIPFEKSRDAIGGLLAVNAQQPLFLLSKSRGPVHMGVAYVPKDFNEFRSKHWTEHVREQLGGEHFPPKGKLSKHDVTLIKIQIKGNREKEASEIVKVAEKFISGKQFQKRDSDVIM